jgi:hypothetical protein
LIEELFSGETLPTPVEQISYVTAILTSLFNHSVIWKQPLNPILGETFTGYIGKDTKFYIEQVSHHPPISYVTLYNTHFQAHGYHQANSKLRLPNVKIEIDGRFNIEMLKTGWKFVIKQPNLRIKGVMTGARKFIVEGKGYVYGAGNKVQEYTQVTESLGKNIKLNKFGSERLLVLVNFGGETKGIFKQKRVHPRDHVKGKLFEVKGSLVK